MWRRRSRSRRLRHRFRSAPPITGLCWRSSRWLTATLRDPLINLGLQKPPVTTEPEAGKLPLLAKVIDGGGMAVQVIGDVLEGHHSQFGVRAKPARTWTPAHSLCFSFFSRVHRDLRQARGTGSALQSALAGHWPPVRWLRSALSATSRIQADSASPILRTGSSRSLLLSRNTNLNHLRALPSLLHIDRL